MAVVSNIEHSEVPLLTKEGMEKLFLSTSKDVHHKTANIFGATTAAFLNEYTSLSLDGTEDSFRCKAISSARLAQLGLTMFQFFGSAVETLNKGKADELACSATANVVGLAMEKKIDELIADAAGVIN